MPGYRPPSTEPRGKWAVAIHKKRRAEKLSRTGAFELLGPKLGFGPKSLWSFTALDMGTREPNEDEAAVLADWLGGYPTDAAPEPATATETPDPLVTALAAQTKAITALVGELRSWRTEDRDRLADVEATVKLLAGSGLAGPGIAKPTVPPVPDGTAE